jgi:hypothetical protein
MSYNKRKRSYKMKLVKGIHLTPPQTREVLNAFVYRHLEIGEGKAYPTEKHWLYDHAFYIRKDGHLAQKPARCEPYWF